MIPANAKQRVERWWLLYTPIWGIAVGLVMLTGLAGRWGDAELIALSIALSLGAILPPILRQNAEERARPWFDQTAVKMGLSVVGFALLMNYFLTPYFFEVLGMHYGFKTKLEIQKNPIFLYLMTVPYFATYSALITVGHRTALRFERPAVRWLAIALLPLALAALETALNANPFMRDLFWFDDLPLMLTFGTLSYGVALAAAMPVWIGIDEDRERRTPLRSVLSGVLAATMAMVLVFEILRYWIAPLLSGLQT